MVGMDDFRLQLVRHCDSLLESGELTDTDAYDLADWLNKHDEACLKWPGEDLVQLLQQIWADKKVTQTELRRLAVLLRAIHKEWTKIQFDESMVRARSQVEALVARLPPPEPQLPEISITLPIKSHTQKGVVYNVNLAGLACTCADWRAYRCDLPAGHLWRCCKHVFDAFAQLIPRGTWPGWVGSFVSSGWIVSPKTEWRVIDVGSNRWLVSMPDGQKQWMNFYTQESQAYERYGYSTLERRWAYDMPPRGANKLLQVALARCS